MQAWPKVRARDDAGPQILPFCADLLWGALCVLFLLLSMLWSLGPAMSQTAPPTSDVVPTQPDGAAIERQFLTGLALLNARQAEAAIPLFLEILAVDPTLVRVRLELARAYFEAEQWSRARREFFTALSADLPEPVRLRVLGFIRAIDARRGFDWDLTVGLVTLGNQRDYDSDTIELGEDALPFQLNRNTDSALGARLTGAMSYRQALGRSAAGRTETVGFGRLDFDLLDGPGSEFDDLKVGVSTGLRFLGAQSSVVVSAFARTRHASGSSFEDRYGVEMTFERRTAFGASVFGAASYAEFDNTTRDDLDGTAVRGLLGIRRSLGGRASIGTSLRVEENRVDFDLDNYRDTEWRIFCSYEAAYGITLFPAIAMSYRDFLTPSPLFVQNPNERAIGVDLTLEKNDLFIGDGFSPFLRVSYERGRSDIDAYSYTETQFQIGLERRF